MPVAAVRRAGNPSVNSGSHIAILGIMCGLMKPSLRPSFSVINAPRPTSLPVPAVVGIAISGATFEVIFARPPPISAYCSSGRGVCRQQRNRLPKINRRATAQRDYAIASTCLVQRDAHLRPLVRPDSAVCRRRSPVPDWVITSSTRAITAPLAKPASVTSIGLRIPSSRTLSASFATAPKSNSTVVR